MEEDAIACLVQAGVVVIACGGGGIPVAWEGDRLVGVEGVVDKDRASSLLARDLHAQKLIIVTSVDRAAIRFGRPDQQWLNTITVAQARAYLAAGRVSRRARWVRRSKPPSSLWKAAARSASLPARSMLRPRVRGEAGTHIVAS